MPDPIETTLEAALFGGEAIGQIRIQRTYDGGFILSHRDDQPGDGLEIFSRPEDAIEIARYDDAGTYRPLKTAPNLRHGWRLNLADVARLQRAIDYFYPGRLAILRAWSQNDLATTPLRETLNRQSGMYRVAAKISDEQVDNVVENFCQSDGGCLRTILWKRDAGGNVPSTKLPPQKFDPACDQTDRNEQAIPLFCQEACSLLVNECRKAVKGETNE
jgi:sirohydrochlorin cobaltochelatase